MTEEELKQREHIRALVSQLYMALNVPETYQQDMENMQTQLDEIKAALQPLEEVRLAILTYNRICSAVTLRARHQNLKPTRYPCSNDLWILQEKLRLLIRAERRSKILAWAGLGFMGTQFGFLARLTWWEYSWYG